jgi:hypothetical protein
MGIKRRWQYPEMAPLARSPVDETNGNIPPQSGSSSYEAVAQGLTAEARRYSSRAGCVQIESGIPLYLFVLAAFLRRHVIPLGCKML